MSTNTDLKLAMTLSAALCGLAVSGVADATAVVTLGPASTTVQQGQALATVSITAMVVEGVDSADDVITFHDVFLAYNPAVLTLTGFSWGTALAAAGPTQTAGGMTDYTQELSYDPSTTSGYQLGTVGADALDALGDMNTPYYEGSVRLGQDTGVGPGATTIWDNGGQNGLSLFTAVFSITTSQIASSSIVLIDLRNFTDTGLDYDWKIGTAQTPASVTLNSAQVDVVVPVPAPLALMAAGLLGLGGVRRRLASRA